MSGTSGVDEVVDAVLASSRALVAVSARSIADVTGLTLPQFRMLVVLDGSPTNLTGLAAALDVAPSTALRMVDRLVAHGFVDRTVPQDDRRVTRLALTSAGRLTVRSVLARRRRDLSEVVERIPPERRATVTEAMATFAAAAADLGQVDETRTGGRDRAAGTARTGGAGPGED